VLAWRSSLTGEGIISRSWHLNLFLGKKGHLLTSRNTLLVVSMNSPTRLSGTEETALSTGGGLGAIFGNVRSNRKPILPIRNDDAKR
jgi:hypothetical protein